MNFCYDFEYSKQQWSTPPIAQRNLSTVSLQDKSDSELREWIKNTWDNHWHFHPTLVRLLEIDNKHDNLVLDFGCGFGFDALRYTLGQNKAVVSDINNDNVETASRIVRVGSAGVGPYKQLNITGEYPFIEDIEEKYDIVHANGVMHHIPYASQVFARFSEILKDNGQVILLVYTNEMFKSATGMYPTPDIEVSLEPHFAKYVRYCDAVGMYAN